MILLASIVLAIGWWLAGLRSLATETSLGGLVIAHAWVAGHIIRDLFR